MRQPLTRGEKIVFNFFHRHLNDDWEIYIQPHLNGLRPDFVLLNPLVGIGVFEVKDWDLDAMSYHTKFNSNGDPELWATKDDKTFNLNSKDPITQIAKYRKSIYELYCPRLGTQAGFAAITAGVVFPFAKQDRLERLFVPLMKRHFDQKYRKYNPLIGREILQSGDINDAFPESRRSHSKLMSPDLANDLRGWLVEPDFSSDQRKPLIMDRAQKALAETRTQTGYRRIKGPAGSGKSLVLAARAANLIDQGKKVLVVSFNITLWHYLRDLIVRGSKVQGAMDNLCFTHFHLWCKNVCADSGHEDGYSALFNQQQIADPKRQAVARNRILSQGLPTLVNNILSKAENYRETYDAILVDEGQDFLPGWWDALRKIGNENCEMLLVADATQDIYGTARSWTDEAMNGAGFRGDWAELQTSYRMPAGALSLARRFAQDFLPNDQVDLPELEQNSLDIYPCDLKWVEASKENGIAICKSEILELMKKDKLSVPDITFLCAENADGLKLVEYLEQLNIKTVHSFAETQKETRRKKMAFYMGDARIKATTLNSFKGWESKALVIFINDARDDQAMALIYTGLTRLKRSTEGSMLTVVSCSDRLRTFGKTWSE